MGGENNPQIGEKGLYFGAVFLPYFCLSLAEYKIFIRAPPEAKKCCKKML